MKDNQPTRSVVKERLYAWVRQYPGGDEFPETHLLDKSEFKLTFKNKGRR